MRHEILSAMEEMGFSRVKVTDKSLDTLITAFWNSGLYINRKLCMKYVLYSENGEYELPIAVELDEHLERKHVGYLLRTPKPELSIKLIEDEAYGGVVCTIKEEADNKRISRAEDALSRIYG
jgi:hypothetical protein